MPFYQIFSFRSISLFGALFIGLCACSPVIREKLPTSAQGNTALQSGPMLGYTDMLECLIWVQTKEATSVQVSYRESGTQEALRYTEIQRTHRQNGFIAKCIADQVEPGKTYDYTVILGGKPVQLPYKTIFKTQTLWQWRTDPPPFSVAAGSCHYVNEEKYDRPGKPYGSEFHIFKNIYEQKPDLMLWLGDNVYYREPDWNTRTGMVRRFTLARSMPEVQPLLASANHYAIWDDHDFGPNDSDGSFVHKETARQVFDQFWGNPTCGKDNKGIYTRFEYADMDFFLLDNRYFRTPNFCENCPERTELGKEQLEWFLAGLAQSSAPFKIVAVGGQVLNSIPTHETYMRFFPEERAKILDFIEKEGIKGVIFLTGDRHFTELSALQNKAGNWVYDLTLSSLTAGVNTGSAKEANELRVPGTHAEVHNFGILRFSGPRRSREMQITVYGNDGAVLWNKTVGADYNLK